MAWLNEASNADFYLVKVEAVRIGDSPAAPLLTLIVGPSAEAKEAGRAKQEIAERYDIRKHWWTQLVALPGAKLHAHITPGQYSWIGASSGIRGLGFNYVVTKTDCGAELYIDRGKDCEEENEAIFNQLYRSKSEIEASVSFPVSWQRLDGRRACRIRIDLPGGYRSPEDEWPAIQKRMTEAMITLEAALKPVLMALRIGS
jgi:hypothetical protein